MVDYLLQSLPGIASVFMLEFFCFVTFAILGVALYSGTQYKACRISNDLDKNDEWLSWPDEDLQ